MAPVGYRFHLIAALPATRLELEKRFTISTVHRWLSILYEDKKIHIGGWKRSDGRGPKQPIWHSGPGVDAREPPSYTAKQSKNAYRRRLEQDGSADIIRAKRRAKYAADKAAKKKNTWFSSLLA